MEDPHLPSPAVELRKGLIPKLPKQGMGIEDPRVLLKQEEFEHRKTCLEREARWDAEVFEALAAADVVSRYFFVPQNWPYLYYSCHTIGPSVSPEHLFFFSPS